MENWSHVTIYIPLQPCVQLKTIVKDYMFIWLIFSYGSVIFPTSFLPHVKGLVSFCCLPQLKKKYKELFVWYCHLTGVTMEDTFF